MRGEIKMETKSFKFPKNNVILMYTKHFIINYNKNQTKMGQKVLQCL